MPLILSGTSGVSGVDGSAGTPSYQGNDTNTGIFYPAADTIAFAEGGAEIARFDSSGNFGINTTSPGVKLGVVDTSAGTITFPAIFGNRGTTNSTEVFFGLQTYDSGGAGITNGISSVTTSNTSSAGSADLKFWTTNAATRAERMRITSGGDVLTGGLTSSPGQADPNSTAGQVVALNTKRELRWNNTNASIYGGSGGADDNLYYYSGLNHIFRTSSTERMRITSDGNLLAGTTNTNSLSSEGFRYFGGSGNQYGGFTRTSAAPFFLCRMSSDGQIQQFFRDGTQVGSISVTTSNTSYVTTSDYRLKESIAPMQNALNVVQQLKPVTYTWKSDGSAGQGFIAHELQAVVPDCVVGEKDAVDEEGKPIYQGIDTSFLVATLTAAIQEQQAMIEELKAKVAALEK